MGTRERLDLPAGTIEYLDTGGDGPVVVLLHGLLMDASLWDDIVVRLAPGHRCIAPTLPLGAHRNPVDPDADLSLEGQAALVAALLDRLGLREVTLVGNDTGGAIAQVLAAGGEPRVGRLVLVSCEAFDNLPPGLTGRTVVAAGKLPPALFGAFMQQMRLKPVRRLPIAFGWLTKRGDAVTRRWATPLLGRREIRRDAVRALRALGADGRARRLVDVAGRLAGFDRPALVVWAAGDRVMPPEHGRRLADLLPQARLVEVDDSYTLVPLDQPEVLAGLLRDFARTTAPSGA